MITFLACSSNPCSQKCTFSGGKAVCSCESGYELAEDGSSCNDINECKSSPCDSISESCVNTNGSFELVKFKSNI